MSAVMLCQRPEQVGPTVMTPQASVGDSRGGGGISRWEPAVFYLLLMISLIPIWTVTYFPSQDGPEHLHNAYVLRHLNQPGYELFSTYYQINPALSPNWAGHLLLAGLMTWLPSLVAEKVLLSAYLLAFPLAARYALRGVRPGAGYLSVLAFPLAYNWFYHMGFYNFCFSLPGFMLAVGFYYRQRRELTWGRAAGLGGILMGLYFCHLSGVVMALGVIGWLAVWTAGKGSGGIRSIPFGKLVLAFVPVVALVLLFFFQNTGHEDISPNLSLLSRIKYWGTFLCAFSRWELGFCLGILGLMMLVVGGYYLGGSSPALRETDGKAVHEKWDTHGLGWLVLGLMVCSLVIPANIGRGGFVFHRLVLFTILLGLLYVGRLPVSRGLRLGIWWAAIALSVANWGYYRYAYLRIDDYLQEYVHAGQQIPEANTVLPIVLPGSIKLSYRTWPFRHAAGYLGAQRVLVDLDNYEAEVGYFPLVWRATLNPYRVMRGGQETNNDLDYAVYETGTQGVGRIDYVLTWKCGALAATTQAETRERRINAWLESRYERVFVSGRGFAVLWRKKNEAGGRNTVPW